MASLRLATSWKPAIAALLAACLLLGGCQGCRRWNPFAKKAKKAKKKVAQRPYSFRPLAVYPSDTRTEGLKPVKPGHVAEFQWGARSNLRNVRGDLQLSVVDPRSGTPLLVPGTHFQVTYNRTVVLPKGQDKQFRLIYPLPVPPDGEKAKFALMHRLIPRQSRSTLNLTQDPVTPIPGYQYFLVVLAAEPDRYSFVRQLYALQQPPFDLAMEDPPVYYQVVSSEQDRPLPLPEHPLAWSPIAYILWDEMLPQRLAESQMQSLIDWLHWGGQLIISGPGSLDTMKGSRLEAFLPAFSANNVRLGPEDFAAMHDTWEFETDGKHGSPRIEILPDRPLGGVSLELSEGGRFVPGTGKLVADRRVGRGRIVVTAFPIDARPVIRWVGYDSFFHGCLLGKPRRRFHVVGEVQPAWSYAFLSRQEKKTTIPDVVLGTSVRYFSRDTANSPVLDVETGGEPLIPDDAARRTVSGMAAWNDDGVVAEAAERSLQRASGITIPSRDFVWKNLAIYLVILVPVNWGLFRLLGRVEWAWIATPLIAVGGAVWIVREAQLNIGFARSRSEVGVLELQPEYTRGHLTRFVALYSSLSTSFQLEYDSPRAVPLPFRGGGKLGLQVTRSASLRVDEHTRLSGFQVDSNSTAMIHSEEFTDVGGAIQLDTSGPRWKLLNASRLDLKGAAVIRRSGGGELEAAWIGDLATRATVTLDFQPASSARPWFRQWDELPVSAESAETAARLPSVRRLLEIAVRNVPLRRGEARLVGWAETTLPGLRIQPAISQAYGVTFVLQHLHYAPTRPPRADVNLIEHVRLREPGTIDVSSTRLP